MEDIGGEYLDLFNYKPFYDLDIVNRVPIRVENKIGNNDKCPCGSDLKYKKCCKNKML